MFLLSSDADRRAHQAARILAVLPLDAWDKVSKYVFPRDAKMALASRLLKHYAIAKLSVNPAHTWSQLLADPSAFTSDARTKPIYIDPATGMQPVSFNVTHQAGVVAIVAAANRPRRPRPPSSHSSAGKASDDDAPIEVGVDIVCTSERRPRDQDLISRAGWAHFLDMHKDALAPGEVRYLQYRVLSTAPGLVADAALAHPSGGGGGGPTPEQVADGKLRAFYALWALREAYIKLSGEALLAPWLTELEFVNFRPPRPTASWDVAADEGEKGDGGLDGEDSQVIRSSEMRLRGEKVEDVNMCLRSIGPDFMIATAVRTPSNPAEALGWRLGPYEVLSLDEVLRFAESSR